MPIKFFHKGGTDTDILFISLERWPSTFNQEYYDDITDATN